MNFKIITGSPTYEKLTALLEEIKAANRAAEILALSLGASEWALDSSPFVIAGGLTGLKLTEKPKGWKNVYKKHHNDVYFPMDKGPSKEAYTKIEALPRVQTKQLADIVGFEAQEAFINGVTRYFTTPSFSHGNGNYLLSMPDELQYVPLNEDIIEITTSEHKKLLAYEP